MPKSSNASNQTSSLKRNGGSLSREFTGSGAQAKVKSASRSGGQGLNKETSEVLRMRQNTTERRQQGPLKSIGYSEHIVHIIDNSNKYRSKPEQDEEKTRQITQQ